MNRMRLTPTLASWPAPLGADVGPAAAAPAVVTSRKELEVAPVPPRRPFVFVVVCPEPPCLSLVLDASDLESSGAARAFEGAIAVYVLKSGGPHS